MAGTGRDGAHSNGQQRTGGRAICEQGIRHGLVVPGIAAVWPVHAHGAGKYESLRWGHEVLPTVEL